VRRQRKASFIIGDALLKRFALACLFFAATPAFADTPVSGNITTNTNWTLAQSPFIVTGTVTVSNNATLTIDPGVVVKFNASAGLQIGSGTPGVLNAQGTVSQQILFTSNNATPAPGQWSGIRFLITTSASILDQCIIEYGGAGTSDTNLRIDSDSPTIRHCTIRQSDGAGILLGNVRPIIQHNTITANNLGILVSNASTFEDIKHNRIEGNTVGGLNNTDPADAVTCHLNWWGHASGPSGIGPGTGQSITGKAVFEPWLSQIPTEPFKWADVFVTPDPFSQAGGAANVFGRLQANGNWTITLRNSSFAVVKTFSGTGTIVNQDWLGDNAAGTALPDGEYSFQMSATSTGTGQAAAVATGKLTLNSVFPIARLTSPAPQQTFLTDDPVALVGTADDVDASTYTISRGVGFAPTTFTQLFSSSAQIVNSTLFTFNPQGLTPGMYTFRLKVTDAASHVTQFDRQVTFDHLLITNVSVAPNPAVIDPYNSETVGINYTLDRAANVTIRLYDEKTKQLIRTLSFPSRPAGPNTSSWDGRNAANAVAPLEAYFFTIEAIDTTNPARKGTYNNAVTPFPGPFPGTSLGAADATEFGPYQNGVLRIDFSFNPAGRLRLIIRKPNGSLIRTLLDQAALTANTHTVIWDGRQDDGTFHLGPFEAFFDVPVPLPKDVIILQHTLPNLDDFRAQAFVIQPVFNEVSQFTYTLSQNANVTMTILDPNGNTIRTLLSNAAQAAGSQTVEWDGRTDAGKVAGVEGDYRVNVVATDPVSGLSATRAGVVTVFK